MVAPKIKIMRLLLAAFFAMLVLGCSSVDDTDDTDGTPMPIDTADVAAIVVTATPDSVNFNGTSTIGATVYDSSGSPVAGVQLLFELDQPSLGSVTPPIAVTNASGIAQATLTARSQQGNVNVTASNGTITSTATPISIQSGVMVSTIDVTATPATILIASTSTIRAEVLDSVGAAVPNGTTVLFAAANTTFGTMAVGSATTVNGIATATFQAGRTPGTAVINASSGGITNSVDVLINQTAPASLEYISATPSLIALQGSGGIETSDVLFRVNDESGNPLGSVSVSMTLQGPGGGEYIDNDTTPLSIDVSSDANGIARVTLRSGSVAGPATILAEITVGNVVFRARSSVVSIGGGVPSAGRFSVAASRLNLPALNENNVTTEITAYLSDRFGNYNILPGTTVSFYTEPALTIDTSGSVAVAADGTATVKARTQHPNQPAYPVPGGYDVAPLAWEVTLLDYVRTFYSPYGWPGDTTPRDGLVSVLVVTDGEEHYDDLNANGIYDAGTDPFYDTHDDPFLDFNDNGIYNAAGIDPAEIFVDANRNGIWNSYNSIWDNQKKLFHNFKILITGEPEIMICAVKDSGQPTESCELTFDIADGGVQYFRYIVADQNLNYPSAGTTINATADKGKLLSETIEMDDSSALPGKIEYVAVLRDDKIGDTSPPELAEFKVTVDWEGKTKIVSIFGTID